MSEPATLGRAGSPGGDASAVTRFWGQPGVRKAAIVAVLLVAWELLTRWAASPLLFPTAVSVLQAFARSIGNGEVPGYAAQSLQVLLCGMAIGAALALIFLPTADDVPLTFGWGLLTHHGACHTDRPEFESLRNYNSGCQRWGAWLDLRERRLLNRIPR